MGPTAATTGAVPIHPTKPPAPSIARPPDDGVGEPWVRCQIPTTPRINAELPITKRPVVAFWSGCRKKRHANANKQIGASQDKAPKMVVEIAPDQAMNQPSTRNQVAAATMTAAAISARPSPSRRCSGSRSLAPRPMPRAMVPTNSARDPHTAWPPRPNAARNRTKMPGRC